MKTYLQATILLVFIALTSRLAMAQTDLITNGGFESGTNGWTRSGNFYASSRFKTSHTGKGYAYLLTAEDGTKGNNLSGYISQIITIPPTANTATLSFWYYITSDETTTTKAYDKLTVSIQDLAGNTSTLKKLSNLDAGSGGVYTNLSFSLSSYVGKTIAVNFQGTTDGGKPTVFRIDDVSVQATIPPDAPPVSTELKVSPRTINLGSTATVSYTVTDDVGLLRVDLWRIKQDAKPTSGADFTRIYPSNSASGLQSSGSFTDDTHPTAGTYWYVIHPIDTKFQVGFEPPSGPVRVTVNEPTATGTLSVKTTPVSGEVFVGGSSKGNSPWSGSVSVGSHIVSFGSVSGYTTPTAQTVTVNANQTTSVTGVYAPLARTLTVHSANPNSGVNITIDAADNNGAGNGTTPFTRRYGFVIANGQKPTIFAYFESPSRM